MTCANKEITKMLAAIVGCSRKQLSLTGVRFSFFRLLPQSASISLSFSLFSHCLSLPLSRSLSLSPFLSVLFSRSLSLSLVHSLSRSLVCVALLMID